ncbi:MAG: hypothetical protein QGG48_10200, partial [Desulfatiglandales bacterium]|nr:hypothetical protein [Desulfatiglandales bacterium]
FAGLSARKYNKEFKGHQMISFYLADSERSISRDFSAAFKILSTKSESPSIRSLLLKLMFARRRDLTTDQPPVVLVTICWWNNLCL